MTWKILCMEMPSLNLKTNSQYVTAFCFPVDCVTVVHTCSHTHHPSVFWQSVRSSGLSQGALQRVVVVFETFELQKVFGSLAALAGGGQVGDLDGGGGAPDRRACQVLGCGLVMLVQAGGAGIGLHPEGGERQSKRELLYKKVYYVR